MSVPGADYTSSRMEQARVIEGIPCRVRRGVLRDLYGWPAPRLLTAALASMVNLTMHWCREVWLLCKGALAASSTCASEAFGGLR